MTENLKSALSWKIAKSRKNQSTNIFSQHSTTKEFKKYTVKLTIWDKPKQSYFYDNL